MKYQHRVVGMLWLLAVITYLDRVCMAVAGPRMQDSLHISPETWAGSAAFSSFPTAHSKYPRALGEIALARVAFSPEWLPGGQPSRRSPGRCQNTAFCFSYGSVSALAKAGAYPNVSAVIGRWIPLAKRTRAWGIVWMTSQVGAALSPLLVVPIQGHYGWRAPFLVFGFLGLAWSLTWYIWFRDSPHEKAGISPAELREIGSIPGFERHGIPWATALRLPSLWRIAAIGACYVYSLGFFQAWLQTYMVKGRRGFTEAALVLSSLTYGVGATANALGGLVGDWLVGAAWPAQRPPLDRRRRAGLGGAVLHCCDLFARR